LQNKDDIEHKNSNKVEEKRSTFSWRNVVVLVHIIALVVVVMSV
jgi:hypothetical protein